MGDNLVREPDGLAFGMLVTAFDEVYVARVLRGVLWLESLLYVLPRATCRLP